MEKAKRVYKELKSEAARLKAVKEQILIRYLGLGWVDAHHPWSKDEVTFKSRHLFNHLINVVIPLAETNEVPAEPPLSLPTPPEAMRLGTRSKRADQSMQAASDFIDEQRSRGEQERSNREARGEGDRFSEWQETLPPKFTQKELKDFDIEIYFEYKGDDGMPFLDWARGKVVEIVNEKTRVVEIEWEKGHVAKGDKTRTRQKLPPTKWNPNMEVKGAWRQYFEKLDI